MKSRWYDSVKWGMSEKITEKVEKLVETEGKYVSNIENDLRNMGEHELANDFLSEIEESLGIVDENQVDEVFKKRVRSQGNSGAIFVPLRLRGRTVKVLVLNEKE